MKKNKIIITIPAYNEENTIGSAIDEIKEIMSKTSYRYEIQVINDGSSDKTVLIAKKHGAKVYGYLRNKGLLHAFQYEITQCLKNKADIIVHTDADGQYDPKDIPKLIEKIEEGYDLVLGSRFKGKISYKNEFGKLLGNIIFAKAISKMIKTKVTDSTTGFRAFTKDVAREIKFINTFTYTQEQLIKASKQGFKITEIPITARKTRKSKLFKNPFDYAIKAWINIFRIYRDFNPLMFFGKIGVYFLLVGGAIGLGLVYKFLTSGKVGHIPLTILCILLIMIGIQLILFGFLADGKKNE